MCVHVARQKLGDRLLCGGSQHTPARARDANQHNSTATRTPGPLSTLHRAVVVLPIPIYLYLNLNLCCVRGRHSLAAPRGLQPEITALVRRGRKSFDSPLAMMHTRRSSAHVSLLADRLLLQSCAHNMRPAASRGECGCAPRRALAVGTLPRPLRGLRGPRHSCQLSSQLPGRALRHRRAAPTPSSA